jgi:hypothetical protein
MEKEEINFLRAATGYRITVFNTITKANIEGIPECLNN